jgi:hypothetical protein
VVNDGGTNSDVAVNAGRRGSYAAALLKIDDDLRVDAVGVVCTIAEADNVEFDRS